MLYDCCVQEKNVSTQNLDGKVGRMYVPQQDLGSMATRKMKVGWNLHIQCSARHLLSMPLT